MPAAKAAALGLPRGPLFAALKRGESVALEDGRRVLPEQVLDPAESGAHFLIVGEVVAGSALLGRLVADSTLRAYAEGGTLHGRLTLVVHLSRRSSLESEAYQRWARSLGPTAQHVYLDQEMACPSSSGFFAARLLRAKLTAVCPEICAAAEGHSPGLVSSEDIAVAGWVRGRSLQSFVLAPRRKLGLLAPDAPPIDEEETQFIETLRENQELHSLLAEAHRLRDLSMSDEFPCPEDRLLRSEKGGLCFLGRVTEVALIH